MWDNILLKTLFIPAYYRYDPWQVLNRTQLLCLYTRDRGLFQTLMSSKLTELITKLANPPPPNIILTLSMTKPACERPFSKATPIKL